jgi:hypothetical protein
MVPFDYITALESELKKEKVSKSCIEEKFKVMHPQSVGRTFKIEKKPQEEEKDLSTVHRDINKSNSTALFKESPDSVKYQSKHKIGPKNIEFFKFR